MTISTSSRSDAWPALPLEAWSETCATLHMLTQIVGKVRLAQTPWLLYFLQSTYEAAAALASGIAACWNVPAIRRVAPESSRATAPIVRERVSPSGPSFLGRRCHWCSSVAASASATPLSA